MSPGQTPSDGKRSAYLAGTIGCGIGAVVFLLLSVAAISAGTRTGPLVVILPLLTVGAIIAVAVCAKNAIALGMVQVTAKVVTPSRAPLGGEIRVAFRLLPRRQFQFSRFDLTLEMEEHAINRGGTTDSHYRHKVPIDVQTLPGLESRPGIETEVATTFTIPATAPPTFNGRNNDILWRVKIHAAVPGWRPDVSDQVEFDVVPEVVEEAARG